MFKKAHETIMQEVFQKKDKHNSMISKNKELTFHSVETKKYIST